MLVLIVLTSLVLITLDERGAGVIGSARTAAQDVVSPLQSAADAVIDPVVDFVDDIGRAGRLEDENQRLRRELTAARATRCSGREALDENDRLRSLQDLPQVSDLGGVTAEVTGGSVSNFERTFQITKGSADGIAQGQPVVTVSDRTGVLLGLVTENVSRHRAIVQRIDDPEFGVGVSIAVEGAAPVPGLASGRRDSTLLRVAIQQADTTVPKGSVAFTGAAGSEFPPHLVVGTIVRAVDPGPAALRVTDLRPFVDLDMLDFVKVLDWPPKIAPVP